jgi:hypothetical protein
MRYRKNLLHKYHRENREKMTKKVKKEPTQLVGCRIPKSTYNKLEITCIEKKQKISKVLQGAVMEFLKSKN